MRHLFAVITLAMLTSVSVDAGVKFRVTKSMFRADTVEKAKEKAVDEKKPISFVLSKENSSCPYCNAATSDVLRALKTKTVVVFVEFADWTKLPEAAQAALKDPKVGTSIPRTAVLTPDFSEVVCLIPYRKKSGDRRVVIREAKKNVEEAVKKLRKRPVSK